MFEHNFYLTTKKGITQIAVHKATTELIMGWIMK